MIGRSKLDKEFFSAPLYPAHIFSAGKIQVQHDAGTYCIESLSTLEKLLAEKRSKKEIPILRFLVDSSGVAWFARETHLGIDAPKHFQMTGESLEKARCLTAGNIRFKNSACRVLKKINHRSGDFHPTFQSLRLFLAILILNEKTLPFKLPRVLKVKEINSNGDEAGKYKWSVAQLRKWINSFSDNKELIHMLTRQDADTKIVSYGKRIYLLPEGEKNPPIAGVALPYYT